MHLADITMFYAAEGGGVSTYLNAKARWLTRRGVTHTILSPNLPNDGHVITLPSLPVPGLAGYRWPWTVARCAKLVNRVQPDIVEAGDAGPCAWAALRARRRLGIPAIAFYHSDTPSLLRRRLGRFVEQGAERYLLSLYRQFDLVLAPSRLMVQRLLRLGLRDVVHQPLGIDSRVFCPQRRDPALRAALGLPRDARVLVYAGRFTREKKLNLLVEAVRRLGRPYFGLLVGTGDPVALGPRVLHLPFLHDPSMLAAVLASSDALVHPGDEETFGLIALEAMAAGLPVVSTGGAIAELVDPRAGAIVQPNSSAALCEGVDAVFQLDRTQAAVRARATAERYDWERILPQLVARYVGVIAANAAQAPQRGGQRYVAD